MRSKLIPLLIVVLVFAGGYLGFYLGAMMSENEQASKLAKRGHVKLGELPFQLSLRRNGSHFCGASLIKVQGIQLSVSAAGCVIPGEDEITVVAGSIDLGSIIGFAQSRQVIKMVPHEHYNEQNLSNDLAVLFINRPFHKNRYVQPINLYTKSQDSIDGNVTISGWGTMGSGDSGKISEKLQAGNMSVVSHDICKDKWAHHSKHPIKIGNDILCIGTATEKHFDGDIGGPAAININQQRWFLVGVMSFVEPSGEHPDYAAGFTEVSKYIHWINYQVVRYRDNLKML